MQMLTSRRIRSGRVRPIGISSRAGGSGRNELSAKAIAAMMHVAKRWSDIAATWRSQPRRSWVIVVPPTRRVCPGEPGTGEEATLSIAGWYRACRRRANPRHSGGALSARAGSVLGSEQEKRRHYRRAWKVWLILLNNPQWDGLLGRTQLLR